MHILSQYLDTYAAGDDRVETSEPNDQLLNSVVYGNP